MRPSGFLACPTMVINEIVKDWISRVSTVEKKKCQKQTTPPPKKKQKKQKKTKKTNKTKQKKTKTCD